MSLRNVDSDAARLPNVATTAPGQRLCHVRLIPRPTQNE
jgi:hypothetical protein